ncbi:MAG: carboxypeptidase regulatory-like domain-containing protein [Planctomycetota bacterium]|nr:carboxypeptidase regulatory-like domain-containing protein [Planctomycetota bacterium]
MRTVIAMDVDAPLPVPLPARPGPRRGAALLALFCWSCDAQAPSPPSSPAPARADAPSGETREAPREFARGAPPRTAGERAGVLVGRVVYRGPLPESTTMYLPEPGTVEAHTIIVDPETRGLKNVAVWVEGVRPELPATRLEPAVVDQKNWTFLPHVLAVRAGQEVVFRNSDIANHNVHSTSRGHGFNLGTPTGAGVPHRFRRLTGDEPVAIRCDIHHWMLAWIYVLGNDAFAVTDPAGNFRIDGLPAGKWRVRAHHADGKLAAHLEVEVPESAAEVSVELEVRP